MTTEQLLIPRYKVIADYPASPYKVGEVLIFWEISQGYDESKRPITLDLQDSGLEFQRMVNEEEFKKYPHLFRPLQWWEERRISDLPNYIRITGDVYKVDEWFNNVGNHPRSVENPNLAIEWHFIAGHSIPTTLEEYLTYINSKK